VIGPTLGAALLNGLPIQAVFVASTLIALGGVAIFAFLSPRRRPGEAAVGQAVASEQVVAAEEAVAAGEAAAEEATAPAEAVSEEEA